MDRRRPARRRLKAAVFLFLAAPALGASAPLPLAALRWTEPRLALDSFTRQSPECVALPGNSAGGTTSAPCKAISPCAGRTNFTSLQPSASW